MTDKTTIDEKALRLLEIEIKLHINRSLYEKGAITEEMFIKAKDMILRAP